jgi:hypothetical protein
MAARAARSRVPIAIMAMPRTCNAHLIGLSVDVVKEQIT